MPISLSVLTEGLTIATITLIMGFVVGFWMGLLSRWSIAIINELKKLVFPKGEAR